MKRLTSFLLLVLLPALVSAEIYRWTDAEGRVHFSDEPHNTMPSEQVSVRVNSYESVTYESLGSYTPPSDKRVIMYSTSWCTYCKKARNYFERNRVRYVEYDIEESTRARKEFDQLGGRGVPLIVVGRTKMSGFSEAGFREIYD
ncbi:MAG: glutaredoxin family protein [Alcanivoracaceae bacterium]|nr:glutaredoxin family protein [Alcanivoracaceae bacterium]